MGPTLKIPSARDIETDYATPLDQNPRVRDAVRQVEQAGAHLNAIKAATEHLRTARASGSHMDLLSALQDAPQPGDLERAEVELAAAARACEQARQTAREEREARFREYARPQIAKLIADLENVLKRNEEFHGVCEARFMALSGSQPFVDSPDFVTRLAPMVEAYKEAVMAEYGIDE